MVPALSAGHQAFGGAGTVALVTGASSGIGEGTALALAALGARVTVVARRADRLDALVEKIKGTGGHALAVGADITDEGQAHASVARTVETYGRLDTVVANAGVTILGPITGADTTDWRRMIELNTLGLMHTAHAAAPHLLEAAADGPAKSPTSSWSAAPRAVCSWSDRRSSRIDRGDAGASARPAWVHSTHAPGAGPHYRRRCGQ
ncbi:short chain dehydrogenase [Streptomyces sp. MnatMP-M27]|uniref:SDR family NAD(P)-dependent oxidoreductase n=1 Tax=Streptomyces sp. MnatMP-M27 TaxID=1839768 RepID=UPI00081DEC9D|nr:SDR family NAD(P)-dependent oxidoreductase [Streptomyces sp. MnatMP-M27]SCF83066.1 short chain dehydrogenase [Streptomyces sp. MnatMP-M27]